MIVWLTTLGSMTVFLACSPPVPCVPTSVFGDVRGHLHCSGSGHLLWEAHPIARTRGLLFQEGLVLCSPYSLGTYSGDHSDFSVPKSPFPFLPQTPREFCPRAREADGSFPVQKGASTDVMDSRLCAGHSQHPRGRVTCVSFLPGSPRLESGRLWGSQVTGVHPGDRPGGGQKEGAIWRTGQQ
jgi:hypothetical protein